ncbi:probable serine/threonine-protein kinase PBL21 [Magnolia sinica]|uniref:probable serine/threonine-protein kinase PBL21 n=1 Tax=Magnolia sinica TaxID=86752 RepID=UPI00265AEFCA|nr:probable serine/threonine-protein kinase PBL21 [Magnolia sinica]
MGCSQSSCIISGECENDGKNQVGSSLADDQRSGERSNCEKMKWGLNLIRRRQQRGIKDAFENNKTWLLGESGGVQMESVDPQSTHSSFRFSFGSQAELESLSLNSTTTTVIMVNLEKGSNEGAVETRCRELQMRRIESLERNISSVACSLVRFTFAEIRSATKDFCRGKVLGRGAHSCVFRGRLRYGRSVAIKRLNNEEKESAKDFCRELMIASSLDNRNVVPLVGFCIDQDGLFLVYKFVSGGSLERHLHDNKRGKSYPLPWFTRYKVAIGIAEAITYLHNGTEKCVIHRDIKPSNILLSSKKTPKLCDFGLATWTPAPSSPFLCKTVKGTFGYLAPEYFQHGKVSDKTDVYAFGVVLLELITGRKPIETRRSHADENLVLWAKPLLQQEGDIGELLDPQLRHSSYSSSQFSRMVRAAAACVNSEESQRPSINQVVALLRGDEHQITDKSSFGKNSCIGFYNQQTKSDVNGHLALAMLGVSDLDEDDFYCR